MRIIKSGFISIALFLSGCASNDVMDLSMYRGERVEYPGSNRFFPRLVAAMGCPLEDLKAWYYPSPELYAFLRYGNYVSVRCEGRDKRDYDCVFNVDAAMVNHLLCLNDEGIEQRYSGIVRGE